MKQKSNLQTVKRETLEEQVYKILRSAILDNRFIGGQRLIQEDLALELGTSRIPVRDALKRLSSDGLVTVDEQGAYRATKFEIEDVEELYDLRVLLETHAATAALKKITPERLEDLRTIFDEMAQAAHENDAEGYIRLNTHFHMCLYETSGLTRLLRIIETLWHGRPSLTPINISGQLSRSLQEHQNILEALEINDEIQLRDLLSRHITNAKHALIHHLSQEAPKEPI